MHRRSALSQRIRALLSTTSGRRGIFLPMPFSVRVRRVLHLAAELNTKERAEVAAELIAGLEGADEKLSPEEWKGDVAGRDREEAR